MKFGEDDLWLLQPRPRIRIAAICLRISLAFFAYPQRAASNSLENYDGCGMEGDARSPAVQALNRFKNRYVAPKPEQIDRAITLAALLAPGMTRGVGR